jgi:hypothetical protein
MKQNGMKPDGPHPGINMHKFTVGSGAAGFIVAAGVVLIALIGMPMVKYFLLLAIVVGAGIAAVLRWMRK